MANNWNISDRLEKKIKNRDKICVYCRAVFRDNFRDKATWEHIDNNENNICESNITLCCHSCNASKGNRKLEDWLNSLYCKKKKINEETVASIIKQFINEAG